MSKIIHARGQDVRRYILGNVEKNPSDIASVTAEHFGISRQAVNKHLHNLVAELALVPSGNTRNRSYKLASLLKWSGYFPITPELAEDVIWTDKIAPLLATYPENIRDIWHFCFTEMFNNALDHSGGTGIYISMVRTAANTQMYISDDGVGIFTKIKSALNLLDERHAILELSKGKLTTDPEKHTGQGIFFTSRLLDSFDILSGGVCFSHEFGSEEDWIVERQQPKSGTSVFLKLDNHTSRTCKKVFDRYSSEDDYGFNKTVVPVRLAQYGNDKLISRSQAKRVLVRVELFKTVLFDFSGVDTIGQAFADEIFRVFAKAHPELELVAVQANTNVKRMIAAARVEKVMSPAPLSFAEQS
jgi:anti-sigma regulatory factor (Ser/Thr protein kinase)